MRHCRRRVSHRCPLQPECGQCGPGSLVVGLREAAVRRGVRVYENTRVTSIEPRLASTVLGDVRAKYIVRATEAYSPTVGAKDIVPVHSSMLVTERLPEAVWDEINWSGRQSVSAEHPFLHLQRTSDDRITIGGDDARIPYKWASSTSAEATATENVHRVYREELDRLFPVLRDHRIETSWQGIFGAPRNWAPAIQFDRSSGVVVAGGYVGEGLTASYLAAKTVRDLLMGQDTVYARLPGSWTASGRGNRNHCARSEAPLSGACGIWVASESCAVRGIQDRQLRQPARRAHRKPRLITDTCRANAGMRT